MPTARDELRELMTRWFGGIELEAPLRFLKSHGYTDEANGFIRLPTSAHNVSEDEMSCIEFLVEEWDFGFRWREIDHGHPPWFFHHPTITIDDLGDIPFWLDLDDPRPAAEQLGAGYAFAGGWSPFKGFRLGRDDSLHYSGDPSLPPLAETDLRGERVVFYPHSWVAIIQPDRSFEVCRMN